MSSNGPERAKQFILQYHAELYSGSAKPFAVLAFCWQGDRILLANVSGRGWCVPSGRIEAAEDSLAAVTRESLEEAGVVQASWREIGWFTVGTPPDTQIALAYLATDFQVEDATDQSESTGCEFFRFEELESIYYDWNRAIEESLRHSRSVAISLR